MASYEKVVKLACKPKAAPPKAKYLDPIIAATYSDDGALQDVCRALTPRFKEPNAIIVFKALIVLHTMIRNGSTDNVLAHLSQSDILRLRNVTNGQWEGYTPPQNLTHYALYLDYRIRAYRDLKHDPIRVQSETNRDHRVGAGEDDHRTSIVGFGSTASGPSNAINKRQTIMGRKLRIMTVEKGLLRETRIVQRMIDTLLECKFYLDDLEDELTITALRLLVKDLLVLFQACNEGVINLLEHYFEMTHVDASAALALYRHFCSQTEGVVEYLTIARKLQNLLNVPVPNLKHAPVSLATSLEEYLNDPNFEQNRIEYKTNKDLADKNLRENKRNKKDGKRAEPTPAVPPLPKPTETPKQATPSTSTAPAEKKPDASKELADFFSSIEQEQTNMFANQPSGPFGQPGAGNPFGHGQLNIPTGAIPGAPSPFLNGAPFLNMQQTGMPSNHLPVQQTGVMPPNPFLAMQAQQTGIMGGMQPQQTGMMGQSPFLAASQSQPSAFLGPGNTASPFARPSSAAPNFATNGAGSLQPLQPQTTGSNPFRQSFLPPQQTGIPNFYAGPFATSNGTNPPPSATLPGALTKVTPPFARPASTPIAGSGAELKPVQSHMTGSRNPFGRPKSPPPPAVPQLPTMGQLATGAGTGMFGGTGAFGGATAEGGVNKGALAPFATGAGSGSIFDSLSNSNSSHPSTAPKVSLSSVASEFTFDHSAKPAESATSPTGQNSPFPLLNQNTSSTFSSTPAISAFSSNPTGSSTATSTASSFLKPQATGFAGSSVVPFKPSSSFGASLIGSLPSIPQGSELKTTSPPLTDAHAITSNFPFGSSQNGQPTGLNGVNGQPTGLNGALNTQPSGLSAFSSLGSSSFGSLQTQMTGGNPFRASMLGQAGAGPMHTTSTMQPGGMGAQPSGLGAQPTGFGASLFGGQSAFNTQPPNGSTPFGQFSAPGSGAFPGSNHPSTQQQPQNAAPLI